MKKNVLRFLADGYRDTFPFVIMVVLTYLSIFLLPKTDMSFGRVALLLGLGVLFSAVGILGSDACAATKNPYVYFFYFSAEIAIYLFISQVSNNSGTVWLLLMPLVGVAVVLLPRLWQVITCIALLAAMVIPIGQSTANTYTQAILSLGAAVLFVAVFSEIAAKEIKARSEVERLATELSEANRKLREYSIQAEELAITKERNRIAREIHDSLGHYLTTVNVQLEVVRVVMDTDRTRSLSALDKAQMLTKDGLAEIRRSISSLRTQPIDLQSLPEVLEKLVEENRSSGILTELKILGTPRQPGKQYELALYRAAQEGLTNVRKHSSASRADVTLDYSAANRIALIIKDNGIGSNGNGNGFGLLGVNERVQLLGGEVRYHNVVGEGFTLEVELPS
jgi:signal transduction histidine kinase